MKKGSAHNDEPPTIDIRDSAAEGAGVAVGNNISPTIIPASDASIVPKLKVQKVIKDNSVVLCPETHLHSSASSQEHFHSDFREVCGMRVRSRITHAPNRKPNAADHAIEFDKVKTLVDGMTHEDSCSSLPCSACTKNIKRDVERANVIDRGHKDKTKKRKHVEVESAETVVAASLTDFVFLGSMLNQIDDGTTQYSREVANESDDDSLSDEGSN